MSKSVLYASNTSTQEVVAAGSSIDFGSIIRKYGSNLSLSGGNVVVKGDGYYNIDTVLTINTSTAGTVNIQVFRDGVPISGAEATSTVDINGIYTISIPTLIRQVCCCENIITVLVSGVAATVTNAAIRVEKV